VVSPNLIFGRLGNRLFQGAYIYAQAKRGEIPDIFIQDPKFFDEYQDEIRTLFGEGIGYLPYVGIHLRRGDYVNNSYYVDLATTGYYIDAINLFPNSKFLVFSDDIEFAKTYFEGSKFAFDDSEDEMEAFNKLASCESQIIANSSFSWWAGYLNSYPQKKVVAPNAEKWYADGNPNRTVCPEDWIRV
jgi:hypothetical protein